MASTETIHADPEIERDVDAAVETDHLEAGVVDGLAGRALDVGDERGRQAAIRPLE